MGESTVLLVVLVVQKAPEVPVPVVITTVVMVESELVAAVLPAVAEEEAEVPAEQQLLVPLAVMPGLLQPVVMVELVVQPAVVLLGQKESMVVTVQPGQILSPVIPPEPVAEAEVEMEEQQVSVVLPEVLVVNMGLVELVAAVEETGVLPAEAEVEGMPE